MIDFAESQGAINGYYCERCRAVWYTINLGAGVTPYMIRCRNKQCADDNRTMKYPSSAMYNVGRLAALHGGKITTEYAWYRPTKRLFHTLEHGERQHILQGGLLLEKFVTAIERHADLNFADFTRASQLLDFLATYYALPAPLSKFAKD